MLVLLIIGMFVLYWPYILGVGGSVLLIWLLVRHFREERSFRRNMTIKKIKEYQTKGIPDNLLPFLQTLETTGTKDSDFLRLCNKYGDYRDSMKKEIIRLNREAEKRGIDDHLNIPA